MTTMREPPIDLAASNRAETNWRPRVGDVSRNAPSNIIDLTPGAGTAAGLGWLPANLSTDAIGDAVDNFSRPASFGQNSGHTAPSPTPTNGGGVSAPSSASPLQVSQPNSLLTAATIPTGQPALVQTANASFVNLASPAASSPSSTFTDLPPGITDPTNYPPENALAVGPNYVVTSESAIIEWTNLTNNQTTTESLYTLFSGEPNSGTTQSLLDSRALYDSATGLYVLSAIQYDTSGQINIDVATSADPSQGWTVSTLLTGSTSTDMNGLAFGQGNIYLTSQVAGGETDS